MKKTFLLVFALVTSLQLMAQGYYTEYCGDAALKAEADKWYADGAWRTGFNKAGADATVNTVLFYQQYQKNPEEWKALFAWLAKTDLLAIPNGKHAIEGTQLVASVEDSQNEPLEKRGSESHVRKIDFQYVVKGTEGFGILDHLTSRPNCPYNSKKDVVHYDYDKSRTKFIESVPGYFNIFFPQDWHIAKVATTQADQTIRVIVIKVSYKD